MASPLAALSVKVVTPGAGAGGGGGGGAGGGTIAVWLAMASGEKQAASMAIASTPLARA
jgi:hypothetical protein